MMRWQWKERAVLALVLGTMIGLTGLGYAADELKTRDRDQLHDVVKDKDQKQDRLKDKDKLHDKIRDKDRIHKEDKQPKKDKARDRLHKTSGLESTEGVQVAQTTQTGHGKNLMTDEERTQMRIKMQNAETEEERNRIREENHEKMKIRAKEMGVTLPEEPLQAGPGNGMGRGRR